MLVLCSWALCDGQTFKALGYPPGESLLEFDNVECANYITSAEALYEMEEAIRNRTFVSTFLSTSIAEVWDHAEEVVTNNACV